MVGTWWEPQSPQEHSQTQAHTGHWRELLGMWSRRKSESAIDFTILEEDWEGRALQRSGGAASGGGQERLEGFTVRFTVGRTGACVCPVPSLYPVSLSRLAQSRPLSPPLSLSLCPSVPLPPSPHSLLSPERSLAGSTGLCRLRVCSPSIQSALGWNALVSLVPVPAPWPCRSPSVCPSASVFPVLITSPAVFFFLSALGTIVTY